MQKFMSQQPRVTKSQALINRAKTKARIKGFASNVAGGAKMVGGAIKGGVRKGAQFLAKPLVREFKMQDAASRKSAIQGQQLNNAYSGTANKNTISMLKRGMMGKKA